MPKTLIFAHLRIYKMSVQKNHELFSIFDIPQIYNITLGIF